MMKLIGSSLHSKELQDMKVEDPWRRASKGLELPTMHALDAGGLLVSDFCKTSFDLCETKPSLEACIWLLPQILAANVGRVMSAGRGKFTTEMSNVPTCRQHVDTFSENIIAKRISTYIYTDSYVQSRYGKLILCRCDSPMSAKSSDSVACRWHVGDMSATFAAKPQISSSMCKQDRAWQTGEKTS